MSSEFIILFVVAAPVFLLLLASLIHRKEHIFWRFRWAITLLSAYALAIWLSIQLQRGGLEPLLWGLLAMFIADRLVPSRGRRSRTSARRKVIAKWEAKTGKKFNSRFYEVDHIIPFSKGGDNSEGNLRVIPKKTNRSKGAKSPWWDLLGR